MSRIGFRNDVPLLFRAMCVVGALCCASWCAAAEGPPVEDRYEHAVVAADHPLASAAGAEVLRQGGNVVDAAVATAFTLSVVRPESCGIGGGGFMIIWNADEQRGVALDYRERAPQAATADMFVREDAAGNRASSERGGLAVAVPGEVAGLLYALEHYGTMSREQVLAPALRIAAGEIAMDDTMRGTLEEVRQDFLQEPGLCDEFPALFALYLNSGEQRDERRFRSPLTGVLEAIAERGFDGFYRGDVGTALVEEVRKRGGVITADDLTGMQPVVRQPLLGKLDGWSVVTMPPPSSGGVALLETLNILSAWDEAHADAPWNEMEPQSADSIHLLTEAFKHAFADRAEYLGDTDFVDVPVSRLISGEYAAALAERIDVERTFPPEHYGRYTLPDDAGTSHFSIIDSHGNAVACTETINTSYGSYVVVPEYGIVLNNEMDDFTAVPGEPNAFGLIQSAANAVEPGKKPLSSMTPTILVRDGKAEYVAGASGGPRIITATLQVLLNMTRHPMTPQAAVAAPRIHHQWLPDELLLEPEFPDALAEELERRGHRVTRRSELAVTQAAAREADGVRGGSDARKGGAPAGW
jgi:gamma-glutamyltranspeptidase/glutathione hydrolase